MSPADALAKPRIKAIFSAFELPGRVKLSSAYSHASEIPDPDGKYAALVRLLDGTRSLDELAAAVRETLNDREVVEALDVLLEAGYLEDGAVAPPERFSDSELERYKANINFFSAFAPHTAAKYEYQLALKDTHVALLGLGGIGSNVCTALAELGFGRITAVDFDRVELSNLNRQVLYGETSVGELKVRVATRRLADFNPTVDFTGIARRISSADDVRALLASAQPDAVINLADRPNGYIDSWVNEACVERGLPLFSASIACELGTAYSVIPGETACYECRVARELRESPELGEELDFIRAHEFSASNGALGPACMFHAYFVSYELLRHILGIGPLLTWNRTLQVNFVTFELGFHEFEPLEDCPVCAPVRVARSLA